MIPPLLFFRHSLFFFFQIGWMFLPCRPCPGYHHGGGGARMIQILIACECEIAHILSGLNKPELLASHRYTRKSPIYSQVIDILASCCLTSRRYASKSLYSGSYTMPEVPCVSCHTPNHLYCAPKLHKSWIFERHALSKFPLYFCFSHILMVISAALHAIYIQISINTR
jgi:hypothetical protein